MKIGIHHTEGFFSELWIPYCESKGIDYKLVDCYRNDIIDQLADCDALMWHYSHKSPKATKFAKQLLYSLEASGKQVFPNFQSVWHFDDKVGQKYLFEACDIPHAPAHAFYSKREALAWAKETTYPTVFKLRNGSASDNVKLVKTQRHAKRLIRKAFGRGFKQYQGWNNLKERIRKIRMGKSNGNELFKGIMRLFWATEYARVTGREKGYVYFQDYIPENDSDIRVFVIGDKAYPLKRMVRKNDFRASGSGIYQTGREHFSDDVIRLAFDVCDKLKTPVLVFDIVFLEGKPLVLEISYGTMPRYNVCEGYFDKDLNWHDGHFDFGGTMVEDLMAAVRQNQQDNR
jgi:glutathione synthase/RimK-type ligase-like ATP-grasp enzyme